MTGKGARKRTWKIARKKRHQKVLMKMFGARKMTRNVLGKEKHMGSGKNRQIVIYLISNYCIISNEN